MIIEPFNLINWEYFGLQIMNENSPKHRGKIYFLEILGPFQKNKAKRNIPQKMSLAFMKFLINEKNLETVMSHSWIYTLVW